MSSDLNIFGNAELAYAICAVAISLFLDKRGREITESESFSTIFTILGQCLNSTAADI